jgi:hypothetical protein
VKDFATARLARKLADSSHPSRRSQANWLNSKLTAFARPSRVFQAAAWVKQNLKSAKDVFANVHAEQFQTHRTTPVHLTSLPLGKGVRWPTDSA